MLSIPAQQITPQIRSLFRADDPAAMRCFSIMDGGAAGDILTDDPADPTWAIVREAGFGSLYLGGKIDAETLRRLIAEFRQRSDVLIGLWEEDPRWALLPPDPDYDGRVLEFTDHPPGEGLDEIIRRAPEGTQLRRVDAALFERGDEHHIMEQIYGSAEAALEKSLGFMLMRGETILSEAFAGPFGLGMAEIGVATPERYRQRGCATLVCAHLILACEQIGYQTYWNCAKENHASAALARKLGYHTEREYRLAAWFQEGAAR